MVFSVPVQDPERALVSLVPHTASVRGGRFEAEAGVRFLKPGVFDAQSIVTVPLVRLVRRLGTLSSEQLACVEAAVMRWLGLAGGA